jgi:hypothetical protein
MSLAMLFANVLPTAMAATCGAVKTLYKDSACCGAPSHEPGVQVIPDPTLRMTGTNPCAYKKNLTSPGMDNHACFANGVQQQGAQSGADVTQGYTGGIATSVTPIASHYYATALCPVNVHWHLGAEHRSAGEYDETGVGPGQSGYPADVNPNARRLASNVRYGYACNKYDSSNSSFTTAYAWKHCVDMYVGETYEVHWPHSALGACGTPNQYQSPFYDGVFCGATSQLLGSLTPQMIADSVGVQGQVFTIINDEAYYYPDLMRGMIVDSDHNMGQDVAVYTGSTTGTSRNNQVCSAYTPITWQVDRKCHLISASSFDKMCADMKQIRDDMTMDLHAHGARELVWTNLSADNLATLP